MLIIMFVKLKIYITPDLFFVIRLSRTLYLMFTVDVLSRNGHYLLVSFFIKLFLFSGMKPYVAYDPFYLPALGPLLT